jgi:diguanylate cyclase (GGDEF)-like protein
MRSLASALRATARHSDAIGRFNANSFAVIAADTDAAQARRLAERLAAAIITKPSTANVPPLPRLRVRVGYHGVAAVGKAAVDAGILMQQADAALRRARAATSDQWLQGFVG